MLTVNTRDDDVSRTDDVPAFEGVYPAVDVHDTPAMLTFLQPICGWCPIVSHHLTLAGIVHHFPVGSRGALEDVAIIVWMVAIHPPLGSIDHNGPFAESSPNTRRTRRGSQPLGLVCRSLGVSFFVHVFSSLEFPVVMPHGWLHLVVQPITRWKQCGGLMAHLSVVPSLPGLQHHRLYAELEQ